MKPNQLKLLLLGGVVLLVAISCVAGYYHRKNSSASRPYYSQIYIGLTNEVYTKHIDDLSVYGNTMLSSFTGMGLQNPTIEFPTIRGYQSYVVTGSKDINGKPMTFRYYSIYPPNQQSINLTLLCEREGFEKVNNEIVHIINTMNFGEPSPGDFESEVYVDNSSNLQFQYPVGWEITRDDKYINLGRKTEMNFTSNVSRYPDTKMETIAAVSQVEPVPVFQYTVTPSDEDLELFEDSITQVRYRVTDHLRRENTNATVIPIASETNLYILVFPDRFKVIRMWDNQKTYSVLNEVMKNQTAMTTEPNPWDK